MVFGSQTLLLKAIFFPINSFHYLERGVKNLLVKGGGQKILKFGKHYYSIVNFSFAPGDIQMIFLIIFQRAHKNFFPKEEIYVCTTNKTGSGPPTLLIGGNWVGQQLLMVFPGGAQKTTRDF